jgi:transcription-repair coupling factor (superfamily II helicase)
MTTVPSTPAPAATPGPDTAGSLAAVPRLLRSEPALAALIGAADATVAVPEAAQAVVAAALAAFTQRTPLLVITATGLDAQRLGDDLSCLIGSDDDGSVETGSGPVVGAVAGPVVVLPAWETLPFERVSPETETMGRRLAVLHALTGTPDSTLPPPPRVIVAPVRAILQRLGPLEGTAPIVIRPGQQVDVAELLPELVTIGYRREHQVEHRGEFAVRGGIIDVFPSTADMPVRIDLWGDEVDRLTAFSISDQRSSHDLRAVALYGCRELVVTPALRNAASALVTRRPWGASVWENLAEGAQFDGMESWLPFLDDTARVLPDLLPAGAQVVLVEPRRIRDRGRPAARRGGRAGRDARGHLGGEGGGRGELPAAARALRASAQRDRGRCHGTAARS